MKYFKCVVLNRCKEEKIGQFSEAYISQTTKPIFFCKVVYMQGIKYVNLIEIGLVVIEMCVVENGDLAVPVNNTLVCCTFSLASGTRPCVSIPIIGYIIYPL